MSLFSLQEKIEESGQGSLPKLRKLRNETRNDQRRRRYGDSAQGGWRLRVVLRGHVEGSQASRPGCLEEDSGQAGIERFNQARTKCSGAQLVAVAMTRLWG